jgi:hypothetical protein
MSRVLKYAEALLGLWLIVEMTVFPTHAALWIALATAIAIATVALIDAGLGVAQGRRLAPALAVATVLLAGFLIGASRVFGHASATWLMVIAGGVIEACALSSIGLPRLRVSALPESQQEQRPEAPRIAA